MHCIDHQGEEERRSRLAAQIGPTWPLCHKPWFLSCHWSLFGLPARSSTTTQPLNYRKHFNLLAFSGVRSLGCSPKTTWISGSSHPWYLVTNLRLWIAEEFLWTKNDDYVFTSLFYIFSHTVNLLGNLPLKCLDVLLTPKVRPGSLEYMGVNMDAVSILLDFLERRLDRVSWEAALRVPRCSFSQVSCRAHVLQPTLNLESPVPTPREHQQGMVCLETALHRRLSL